MNSNRIFAGVDPSKGERRMTVAMLSLRREVLSIKTQPLEEVAGELTACGEIWVALGGPMHPYHSAEVGEISFGEALHRRRIDRARTADAELLRRGIPIRMAPTLENAAPAWMRAGFHLDRKLRESGFVEGGVGCSAPRNLLETHPVACAAVLLGRLPFGRETIEGRIQRQLALYRERVGLPDPMDALEEITAHHLLTGHLALEGIRRAGELDALLAALTAWRAGMEPEAVTWLGNDPEGWICLPGKQLLDKYSKSDYARVGR